MRSSHPSINKRRSCLIALAGAVTILFASACASESERVVTIKLEVSEAGAYALDGSPVSKDDLKHALRAKRPAKGTLLLHVVASPKAPFEAVGQAMQAAQFAGAQVGFVGNEQF